MKSLTTVHVILAGNGSCNFPRVFLDTSPNSVKERAEVSWLAYSRFDPSGSHQITQVFVLGIAECLISRGEKSCLLHTPNHEKQVELQFNFAA
jgi:hypothetical protein